VTDQDVVQAACEELAVVVGALLDTTCTAGASADELNVHWVVTLAFGGIATGTIVFGFEEEGAQALATLIMALDEPSPAPAVADTLQEVCGQALTALGRRSGFEGLRIVETTITAAAPATQPVTMKLEAGERLSTGIACWANEQPVHAGIPAPAPAPAPVAGAPHNLDLILDIDLPLTVRFGETDMTLLALTRLGPGSVIDLGRSPEDPVDVLVNGRLVARGEVVVVSGNYGVRIVEVISAADRLRTVAA
jgi:flagellar motor switch protein FliN